MRRKYVRIGALVAVMVGSVALSAFAQQQPTVAERVASLKATLAASQAVLHQYEWIETTVVSLKGEEKSRKQERCYYGADRKLQKVLLTQPAPESTKRGLRGKIAEKKKEELTDYMKEAVSLVRRYVPSDPARIQAAKDAGKVTLQLTDPGKRARLTFSDYLKSGDSLALDVDLTNNHLLGATVNSYLDSQKEPVTLTATLGMLNDGTTYVAGAVLDAKGKNLKVTVENSGYRKVTQ
jgi:hypothetical protein